MKQNQLFVIFGLEFHRSPSQSRVFARCSRLSVMCLKSSFKRDSFLLSTALSCVCRGGRGLQWAGCRDWAWFSPVKLSTLDDWPMPCLPKVKMAGKKDPSFKNSTTLTPKKLKGTVSRDFLLLVFFLNQFPPSL
jgi:hypothetical protein